VATHTDTQIDSLYLESFVEPERLKNKYSNWAIAVVNLVVRGILYQHLETP